MICVGEVGLGARLWIVGARVGLGARLWIVSARVGLCARLWIVGGGRMVMRRYRNCRKRQFGKKVRKVANL